MDNETIIDISIFIEDILNTEKGYNRNFYTKRKKST